MLMRYQAALRSDRAALPTQSIMPTQSIIIIWLARRNLPHAATYRSR
jgi:hypothetical protein